MKHKKLLSILLITAMILSFAGCTREADNNTTNAETTTSEKQNPILSNAEKEPDTQNENSTQEEQSEQTQQSDESQTKQNPPATEQNSDSNSSKQPEKSKNPSEEEPTEEELLELFDKATYEINDLATEDPTFVVSQIFNHEMEFYYDDEIIIDNFPFVRTSKQYSDLEDYYGQIFTGEALDWLMFKKFADVDGTLYCCIAGGATGFGTKAVSIEKLEENTYQATYENSYIDGSTDKNSTTFSIQKTDAGYRISSIDYCPPLLEHFSRSAE